MHLELGAVGICAGLLKLNKPPGPPGTRILLLANRDIAIGPRFINHEPMIIK